MIPSTNLNLPGIYLSQLSPDDISKRYYANQEVYKTSWFNRLKIFVLMRSYINQLSSFYPYQRVISGTAKAYQEQYEGALKKGAIISAISSFTIFNLARKGYVMPFLRQYGSFLKTHRLFRHYVYALILPVSLCLTWVNRKYLNHTQALWSIHSKRMNKKVTSDAPDTHYPPQMKENSWIGGWRENYISPTDLKKKWENETFVLAAPDFLQPEYQLVEIPLENQQEQEEE